MRTSIGIIYGWGLKSPTYGQATREIRRVAEAFFGLTPDGRLDGHHTRFSWPFEVAGFNDVYWHMSLLYDMGDPKMFAEALVGDKSAAIAVTKVMAREVYQP